MCDINETLVCFTHIFGYRSMLVVVWHARRKKNGMQLEAITYQLANCCCSYSKYGGSCSLALQIVLQTHVILILFFLCFGTSEYNRGSAVSRPDKNLCNLCTIKPIPQFFGGWFCIKIVISWTNLQVREFL